jgi:hypothetical protein
VASRDILLQLWQQVMPLSSDVAWDSAFRYYFWIVPQMVVRITNWESRFEGFLPDQIEPFFMLGHLIPPG